MFKNGANTTLIGGFMAALGASLCCAGPLILLSMGVSGAWIGNLTLVEPYRPVFIVLVGVMFGWSGYQSFKPIEHCDPGTACSIPTVRKRRQMVYVVTLVLALSLVASPYWIPQLT